MSFASKYNKGNGVYFDINTDGFNTCKVKDLDINKQYKLLGVFVFNGKFGKTPAFICDGWIVYGTESMLTTIEEILADPEAVADIKAGKVAIKARTYENSFGKQYAIDFIDI